MHMHALRAPVAFDGTRFLEGGATVLVEGDRIVGVEAFGCELPEGCALTSYDGTVLPGLFDAHSHLVSDGSPGALEAAGSATDDELDAIIDASLRAQLRGGVTTVRDLGDRNYRTVVARDRATPGLPRIVAAGPPVTVAEGHCHYLGGVASGEAAIRDSIAERRDCGVDVVKVMASGGMLTLGSDVYGVQFSPTELRTLVETAHGVGLGVLAHAHSLAGIEHALIAGVDGVEHFTGLVESGIEIPDAVLERTAAAGVIVDPTFGFDQAEFDAMPVPPLILETLKKAGLDVETMIAKRIEIAARLRTHGVRVVTGMDSGAAPTKRHGRIALALGDLVDAGWPMAEVLATATSLAAEACGLADITGSLRAGLAADLLVVGGDLRTGPEPLGVPVHVSARSVQY